MGTVEQGRQQYERERGSARERGYDTRWDREAMLYKSEHPLCLGCQAVGRVTATALVDHVEPHKGDMVKFWKSELWQPACDDHHLIVKPRLEARYFQGKATIADLWLNSPMAIEMTKSLMG